jgi:hypothetical protein
MVKTLELALAEVAGLPEATQERIGQELLAHVAKLRALRSDLEQGIASLEAGHAKPLDIEDIIVRAHKRHGKA